MTKILIDRSTVEQALEALEDMLGWQSLAPQTIQESAKGRAAALRAALVEPDSDSPERRCGGPGCDMTCCQPVAWLTPGQDLHLNNGEGFRFSDWTPLYTAPPQRKPLAEWQINDLMADIDPEDRDSWSFRQGVYAAEKHHGVRK